MLEDAFWKALTNSAECKEGGVIKKAKNLPVVMRLWETPVPIPNTTVKT